MRICSRYEASYKPWTWLRLAGGIRRSASTRMSEIERSAASGLAGPHTAAPALSLRDFNATITKGKLTAELGKQFIRWGKADILNPTDRFAPKDFLTSPIRIFSPSWPRGSSMTRAAIPSISYGSRASLPAARRCSTNAGLCSQAADGLPLEDLGPEFPGRSSFGARWNHLGSGYEFSASFYDGFNSLPVFQGSLNPPEPRSILCGSIRSFGCTASTRRCRSVGSR